MERVTPPEKRRKISDLNMDLNKNPMSMLNEIMQSKKINVEYPFINYDQNTKEFFYRAVFGHYETFGKGPSKKMAQRAAAYKMLQLLADKGFSFSHLLFHNWSICFSKLLIMLTFTAITV